MALAAALSLLLAAAGPVLADTAANVACTRTVTVTGTGEVMADPDRAQLTLGVESRKLKLDDARAEVLHTVEAVLKLTRDLAIDPKYVHATRISVQAEYNWNNAPKERRLTGYFVSRQVQIDLRDLDKLGALVERSIDLGVNQVGDLQLDSSRRADLQRAALTQAVEDARQTAETLARAAGGKLGPARTLSASGQIMGPMPMRSQLKVMSMAADGGAGSYQSGQLTFTGTVQAEYELTQ